MVPQLGEVLAFALVAFGATTVLSGLVRAAASRGRSPDLGQAVLDGALVASIVGVLVATMWPLGMLGVDTGAPPEINLQPFDRLDGAPPMFAVINLLLLVPTTLLLAQRWQRAGVVRLILLGVTLSVAIELVQLAHPLRGTNVDDVALNSIGVAAAAIVGVSVRALVRAWRRRTGRARQRPRDAYEAEVPVRSGDAPFENAS
jgi:hypothetical protein